MKKNVRLGFLASLGILSALGMSGCTNGGVVNHDHIFDEGTIQTEATCHSEGLRVRHCTVEGCQQTKEETIQMTAHNWGTPETVRDAKCNQKGREKVSCTNEGCTQTNEYDTEYGEHNYGAYATKTPADLFKQGEEERTCGDCNGKDPRQTEAKAELAAQFSLTNKGNWSYGYAESFEAGQKVNFIALNATTDAYANENISITGTTVKSNGHAVIAYKLSQDEANGSEIIVKMSVQGKEETSLLKAYMVLANENGDLVGDALTMNAGERQWSFNNETAPLAVNKNYTIYVVFENVGAGDPTANVQLELKAKCIHQFDNGTVTKEATEVTDGIFTRTCGECGKTITSKIPMTGPATPRTWHTANSMSEYSVTKDNGWTYNYVTKGEYFSKYDSDKKVTPNRLDVIDGVWNSTNGKAKIQDSYLEIDDGETMPVIGYTVPSGISKVDYELHMWTGLDGDATPYWITRIVVTDAEGNVKGGDRWNDSHKEEKDFYVNETMEVSEGDRIYLVLEFYGDGYKQGNYDITITEAQDPFVNGNYLEDYDKENNNWVYGYTNDWEWGKDNFSTLTAFSKVDGMYKASEGQAKWQADGYFENEIGSSWPTIGYKIGKDVESVDVHAKLSSTVTDPQGIPHWNGRVLVQDKLGNRRGNIEFLGGETTNGWENTFTLNVQPGDTVYLTLEGKGGWRQGFIDMSVSKHETSGRTEIANFANDFEKAEANPWSYGYCEKSEYFPNWDTNHNVKTKEFESHGWYRCNENDSARMQGDFLKVNNGDLLAIIGYTIPADTTSVTMKLHMWGAKDVALDWVTRVIVVDSTNTLKGDGDRWSDANTSKDDFTYEVTLDVAAGDTVYLVLDHAGDPANEGTASFTLTFEK